jgi:predicted nucleotidyltransferase
LKLHVLSDVHLEFQRWRREWPIDSIECDVHVLAGDIGVGFMGLDFALLRFAKPVIYVPGNHELYGQRTVAKFWQKAREKVAGTHVHLLDNEAVIIDGVRFLGTTLWTDFYLMGIERQEEMGLLAERENSDYKKIFLTRRGPRSRDLYGSAYDWHRSGDRLRWQQVEKWNVAAHEFLIRELFQTGDWDRTVVVTHHAPSARGLGDELDASYASHLDHLVAKTDLWIHGHVHCAQEYAGQRGGRIVQNARGYADRGIDSVPGFRWNRVVELSGPTWQEIRAARATEHRARAVIVANRLIEALRAAGVEAVIFGSLVNQAPSFFRDNSDVDVCITNAGGLRYTDISEIVYQTAGREVCVDLSFLEELKPAVAQRALADGVTHV